MGKKKIAIIIIVALLVIAGVVAAIIHITRPSIEQDQGNGNTGNYNYQTYNNNSNSEIPIGTSTSETTSNIENENKNTNTGNFNEVVANEPKTENATYPEQVTNNNQTQESGYIRSSELGRDGQERDNELSQRDQQKDQAIALGVLDVLRNYNNSSFGNWTLRLSDVDFSAVARDTDTKNILKREANNEWAANMSSYADVQNKILNVEGVREYMQPIDNKDYPTVWVQTHELINEDWPMPNSDHWKPIDEVRREYLIVLDPSTNKVWRIKQMEQTVLNKDVTGYGLPSSHANESTYYSQQR